LVTSLVVPKDGRLSGPQLAWTGERYVTSVGGEIEFEHKHRYLFALPFAEGATVLDIASGEGYGSYLLASVAQQVIGIDIDEASVIHAKTKYKAENLAFVQGECTEIPLSPHTINLVVSFETLEHISYHVKFFKEISRILKQDGTLIISTPDRVPYNELNGAPNPYHLKELDRAEFKSLLNRHFQSIQLLGQSYLEGSVIDPLAGGISEGCEIKGKKRWVCYLDEPTRARKRLVRSTYLIGVASNGSLPKRLANLLTTASGRQPRWGAIQQAQNTEQAMTREIDQLRAALSAAEERQRSLQEAVSAGDQAAEAMRAETATLREVLGCAEHGAAATQIALGDSEAAARAAEARATASEDRLAAALVEIDAQNAASEAKGIEIAGLREAVNRVEQRAAALQSSAGDSEAATRTAEARAKANEDRLAKALAEIDAQNAAVEAMRAEISTVQGALTRADLETRALRGELAVARDLGRAALASLRTSSAPILEAPRNAGWLTVVLRRLGLLSRYPIAVGSVIVDN
jgi:SAM-dependent methyltransferase